MNENIELMMPIKATPYEHQKKAFAFACDKFGVFDNRLKSRGTALLMEMGTGKTIHVPLAERPVPNRSQSCLRFRNSLSERQAAERGEKVRVTVALANNPGIISLLVKISYDVDALKLVSFEASLESVSFGPIENTPFSVLWEESLSGDATDDFTLVTLVFEIVEDAAVGHYDITLEYDPDDVFNNENQNIEFMAVSGGVDVDAYVPGDLDGNGKVQTKDLILLKRFIAGWNVTCNELAADVNRDGKTNMKDVVLLSRYLTGWDVELK